MHGWALRSFGGNLGCFGHQYIQGNYWPSGRTVLELRIGDARSLEQYWLGDLQTSIDSCLLHYEYRILTELLMLWESNMLIINEWSHKDLVGCNLFTPLLHGHINIVHCLHVTVQWKVDADKWMLAFLSYWAVARYRSGFSAVSVSAGFSSI